MMGWSRLYSFQLIARVVKKCLKRSKILYQWYRVPLKFTIVEVASCRFLGKTTMTTGFPYLFGFSCAFFFMFLFSGLLLLQGFLLLLNGSQISRHGV